MNENTPIDVPVEFRRVAIALELDHPYPWHHTCYQGVLEYAELAGWQCVVDPYLVGATGESLGLGYDGIVGRIGHHVADRAHETGTPIVNHWVNSPAKDVPSVFHDQEAGARLAANHLIDRGFDSFAYIGYRQDATFQIDLEAFSSVIADRGLRPPATFKVRRTFESDRDLFAQFRSKLRQWVTDLPKPIGLLVSSNVIGRYFVQICRELELRVPHDCSVIVQTGDYTISTCAKPTLSDIEHDYFRTGYEAAALLDQIMRGEDVARDLPVMVPPKRLVLRESADTFVTPNPLVSEAMRFIADHAGQALVVNEVADAVSTSRRTLERQFEQHLEHSIYETITRFRIDFIKRALIDSTAPLAAVAVDCGFASVSHFTEYFRKSAGITPSRFRKQMQRK